MKKIFYLFLLLLFVSTVGAFAEGKQEGATGSGKKITLDYWYHVNPSYEKANNQILAEFHEKNPNIEIKAVTIPFNEFNKKLLTSFAAGTIPELLQIPQGWSRFYIQTGRILPVTPEILSVSEMEEKFYEPTIAGLHYKGKYYGIPNNYNLTGGGVLYNKDHFREIGADIPDPRETIPYEKLMDIAVKLTKQDDDGNIIREGYAPQALPADLFTCVLMQYGGDVVDENNMAIFNSPEGKKALEWFIHKYKDIKVATTEFGIDTWELFMKEQSSIQLHGPWAAGILNTQYPDVDYGFFKGPNLAGKDDIPHYFDHIGGWGNLVTQTATKNDAITEAAYEWIKFRMQPEPYSIFNHVTGEMPAMKSLVEKPEFTDSEIYAAFIDNLPHGVYWPVRNIGLFRNILVTMIERAVYGEMSVEEALANGEKEINDMFKEYDVRIQETQ